MPGLRGPTRFALELKASVLDSSARDRAAVEKLFVSKVDPYEFAREPDRFARACELLDGVCGGERFGHALEIGCAEGIFTECLSDRCLSVLAVDLSTTALARSRERCRHFAHATFAEWDLRSDPIIGQFDLIAATGVLEYIRRPKTLKMVCERIVSALVPGGYLLVGNTVAEGGIEGRWWAKFLMRGTWINKYLARDPRLQVVSTVLDNFICPFEHVLFRRSEK
jgi:2-polyprenyl-3-methyl-5-hydroxy-6-metoxy-1,4-benzoquinol methylase